jgi:hypothetical protein
MSAYMNMAELHAVMREGAVATGALLSIDTADGARLAAELRLIPAWPESHSASGGVHCATRRV